MREYLTRVLALTKPYRFRFALGLLCGFLSGALAATLPASLALAVNTIFPSESTSTTNTVSLSATSVTTNVVGVAQSGTNSNLELASANKPEVKKKKNLASRIPAPLKAKLDELQKWFRGSTTGKLLVIGLIPAAMFLRSMLTYLNIYLLSWVGIRAANDLRVKLFEHIMHLPLNFFSKSSTAELMTRIEGAMSVHSTITSSFSVIIREPVSVVMLVAGLIAMQPLLSLLTLLIFPICLVPLVIFGRKTRKSDSGVHAKFSNLAKVMHESFTGIRVVKGYNLESAVVGEFRQAVNGITSFFMRSVRAGELPGPLIEFIGSIGVAMVLAWFAFFSVTGTVGSSGDMLFFFMAVFGLYAPVKNLSRLNHQLSLAQATVQPAYNLLTKEKALPEPKDPKPLKAQNAAIRFENVTFSYGEKTVLHNVSLTIQPGQLVALVGRTGSGKTSLANLLLRFYDPVKGAVYIGDTDVRSVASRDLRENVAVVTQATILFNDTIRHNIALGRPGAGNGEIEAAAKHAYAHDFIIEKPNGYDTIAGEKGVNLSGGQQQRIAIARAVLKNAPILILDEATSSLDNEAERIVQTALEELMKGRTTICIAHRLSTIQNADLIVVLDQGRIVEQGDHATLMKHGGLYYKLFNLGFETGPS